MKAIARKHRLTPGRFVLGIVEAPFYPGGLYMISLFYKRKETAARLSIFYTGNLLASAFSGLIAAGIFAGLDGKHGLEGWRWLFLIQGLITGKGPGQRMAIFVLTGCSWCCCGGILSPPQRASQNQMAYS
jgi:MFS family permease